MAYKRVWRDFKRAQDLTVATASLIYAGAVLHVIDRVRVPLGVAVTFTLLWPGVLAGLSLAIPLLVGGLRRMLTGYVWMSFKAGFGQSPRSVLLGVALLGGAAVFIYVQIAQAARGGPYPAPIFSAYAAGIGILMAQAALVRLLEKLPEVRREIEE